MTFGNARRTPQPATSYAPCRLSEVQFPRWDYVWDYVNDDCTELPDAKNGGWVVLLGPEACGPGRPSPPG